ncbi:hypothetical protein FQZ97_936730 [compost metagenome]
MGEVSLDAGPALAVVLDRILIGRRRVGSGVDLAFGDQAAQQVVDAVQQATGHAVAGRFPDWPGQLPVDGAQVVQLGVSHGAILTRNRRGRSDH